MIERHTVGSSFASWPAETRFITPSFLTNSIGMLDLNSIAIGVSPAFRRDDWFEEHVELFPQTPIASITRVDATYEVTTQDGRWFQTSVPPLLAGGFEGSHKLVADLFERRDDGFSLLSEHDESTIVPGLFLCGPAVRHDNHAFCFIYKYRQRFAVVAKATASSLGLQAEELENYRKWGMYLDDLSCCGEECVC